MDADRQADSMGDERQMTTDATDADRLARSIVARQEALRSALSPWVQRRLASPSPALTSRPTALPLTLSQGANLVERSRSRRRAGRVWQPELRSRGMEAIARMAETVSQQQPAIASKYLPRKVDQDAAGGGHLVLAGAGAEQASAGSAELSFAEVQRIAASRGLPIDPEPARARPPSPPQPGSSAARSVQGTASNPAPARTVRRFARVEEITTAGSQQVVPEPAAQLAAAAERPGEPGRPHRRPSARAA